MTTESDSTHRLTYRDAVRMAPVAWLDGEMVTIEGRSGKLLWVRRVGYDWTWPTWCLPERLRRPNAAARRLLEAL